MALAPANRPKPGLKAVYDGREGRRPGGKYSRPSTAVYLVGVSAILASLVVYHYVSDYQLDSQKRDLLAGQRAMKTTIGAAWFPLRDEIEGFVLDAAKPFKGDFVDSEAARWDFRSSPGLYLRLRVADAKDAAGLREHAASSQKDAFTGCFLREPNRAAALGVPDAGAFPDQPWNLGQAYAATWIMSDDWGAMVKGADGPMKVRLYQEQYDKASKVDVKTAADVAKQAKFFLLVLDEDTPEAAQPDGGPPDEPSLQLVPHWSRVHVLDLRTKSELLRLRRQGNARVYFAGEHSSADPETQGAMQRQVNNCSLADQVRAAIVEKGDGGARP
jgi:hypothetical protein